MATYGRFYINEVRDVSDSIIVAVISAAVTLISIYTTAKTTRDKISQEMHEQIAVIKTDMKHMDEKIEQHNGYAKLFNQSIPKIEQHMQDVDRRLESIERK